MNIEVQATPYTEKYKEPEFNNGNLSIRAGKKVDHDYFMSLLDEMQEILKDVKTSLSEEIINERNS